MACLLEAIEFYTFTDEAGRLQAVMDVDGDADDAPDVFGMAKRQDASECAAGPSNVCFCFSLSLPNSRTECLRARDLVCAGYTLLIKCNIQNHLRFGHTVYYMMAVLVSR